MERPPAPHEMPTLPLPVLVVGSRIFDRFLLLRILGRGGMGVVWLAEDESLREQVALKFLPDLVLADEAARADLKAETRRARALAHPHIVRIYDFFESPTHAAIAMEFVEGETLSARRVRSPGGVLSITDIATWLPQLGAALDYAHRDARLVHRDLKPANIMLTRAGAAKVTDFGVARGLADTLTRVSSWHLGGTLVYMSPQQQMGEPPTPADDIYALGALLYEMLTGKPPFFTGNVAMQIHARRPESIAGRRRSLGISDAAPVPRVWEDTIAACLAKDPADRPASAGVMASALAIDATTSRRPRRLWPIVAGVSALAAAAAVTGVVVYSHARRDREQTPASARMVASVESPAKENESAILLTRASIAPLGDIDGAIAREFGRGCVIGAWEDFKSWADGSDRDALAAFDLRAEEHAWVLRGGVASPDGNQRFALRQRGGPGGALAIETAGGGAFELAYVDDQPGRVLVRRLAATDGLETDEEFSITATDYAAAEDFDAIVRNEFGAAARVADWADVLAWAKPRGAAESARLLGLEGERRLWITFRGAALTGDGMARYELVPISPAPESFEYARDEGSGLRVTHENRVRNRILVRRGVDRADAGVSIDESIAFTDAGVPAPWTIIAPGEAKPRIASGKLFAPGDGGELHLQRPLPAGVRGLAFAVRGTLSDSVLGMRHNARLVTRAGFPWEVRIERPAGVRAGLRLAIGPAGAPVFVREVAPVYGEFEFRIVAADRRLRIEIASAASGAQQLSETVALDDFRCAELALLEWAFANEGDREVWIDGVKLQAQ